MCPLPTSTLPPCSSRLLRQSECGLHGPRTILSIAEAVQGYPHQVQGPRRRAPAPIIQLERCDLRPARRCFAPPFSKRERLAIARVQGRRRRRWFLAWSLRLGVPFLFEQHAHRGRADVRCSPEPRLCLLMLLARLEEGGGCGPVKEAKRVALVPAQLMRVGQQPVEQGTVCPSVVSHQPSAISALTVVMGIVDASC